LSSPINSTRPTKEKFLFYLNYMFSELRRRKGRTLLTALGLAVGVGLVVTIAAAFLIARAAKRELAAIRLERAGTSPVPQ